MRVEVGKETLKKEVDIKLINLYDVTYDTFHCLDISIKIYFEYLNKMIKANV